MFRMAQWLNQLESSEEHKVLSYYLEHILKVMITVYLTEFISGQFRTNSLLKKEPSP